MFHNIFFNEVKHSYLNIKTYKSSKDGEIDATEATELEAKKELMKAQEEKVQALHKELQQQSKDVVEMKRKVKTVRFFDYNIIQYL